MIRKVEAYIDRKRLLRKGDRLIAAVSGGADSIALLEILIRLRDRYGYELAALHVNHGLRRVTADRDEQYVKDFCAEKNIPCLTYRVEVRTYAEKNRLSLEEAARILRYRAIGDAAESTGATAIAVAHHKNDQAETVIFQMLRGSGLKGLSGMAPERSAGREFGIPNRKLRVIRPLLSVEKGEIIDFLRTEDIRWCEDETNASDDATRNLIRHRILPVLPAVREDAVEKIAETADYLAKVDDYLRMEASDWIFANRKSGADLEIPADPFGRVPDVLRGYIVMELLRELGAPLKDVGRSQIEAAAGLSEKKVGKRTFLTNGVLAERTYDSIRFGLCSEKEAENSGIGVYTMESRELFPSDPGNFPKKDFTKWFDCDKIKSPIELRSRREGDRFSVVSGGHKKLKDVFIDLKIPRAERDSVPLVASGSDILWIVGYRMSEEYKVSPETRRVLEVSVREAGALTGEGEKEEQK